MGVVRPGYTYIGCDKKKKGAQTLIRSGCGADRRLSPLGDERILVVRRVQKETAEAGALSKSGSSSPWNRLPAIVKDSRIFVSESRHIYSEPRSAHLASHRSSCCLYFLLRLCTFIHSKPPWRCPKKKNLQASSARTQKNTAQGIMGHVAFRFLSGFLSLTRF